PATIPKKLPIMTEPTTDEKPTHKEMRAPYIILDKISRPKSSVPSQYSLEGGWRRSVITCSFIPSFARNVAQIANKMKNNTIIIPANAILFRLNSRQVSRQGLIVLLVGCSTSSSFSSTGFDIFAFPLH